MKAVLREKKRGKAIYKKRRKKNQKTSEKNQPPGVTCEGIATIRKVKVSNLDYDESEIGSSAHCRRIV